MEEHSDARHDPPNEDWLAMLGELVAPLTVAQQLLTSNASTVAAARQVGGSGGPPTGPWYKLCPPHEEDELREVVRRLEYHVRACQAAIATLEKDLAVFDGRKS